MIDHGAVVIIAWILGATQGVLLEELLRSIEYYVKARREERRSRKKIMSSPGPRAPLV
jgi:hypothetical protein